MFNVICVAPTGLFVLTTLTPGLRPGARVVTPLRG
jgi:hypothetical protein